MFHPWDVEGPSDNRQTVSGNKAVTDKTRNRKDSLLFNGLFLPGRAMTRSARIHSCRVCCPRIR